MLARATYLLVCCRGCGQEIGSMARPPPVAWKCSRIPISGAAAATGFGEDIMRGCLCFDAVERMRRGASPKAAAEEAVRNLHRRLAEHGEVHNMAMICMDRNGQVGGAANHRGFFYATASDDHRPGLVEVESCVTPPTPMSF